MRSLRWLISYILVASVGLWMAFFFSMHFIAKAHSQTPPPNPPPAAAGGPAASPPTSPPADAAKLDAPSSGDLPPEFTQDLEQALKDKPKPGATPPADPAENGGGQKPAAAAQAPPQLPPPSQTPPLPTPPQVVPAQNLPNNGMGPGPEEGGPPIVAPQFADDDQYTYDPTGRRDPFRPYRAFRASVGPQGKTIDLSDPLQRWDLFSFSLVAIMWEVRNPRAMVKDPDGKMYMIAKNTKIGRNFGQVVAIREGEVVVVETVDNEGVQTKEVKILELKK